MLTLLEDKFLYNPDKHLAFCHAPSVLETLSGDILVTWYAYPDVEYKDAQLVLARKPAGRHWESEQLISGKIAYSEGNPVLFQEPGGRIWLFFVLLKGIYWNDSELNGRYSDDGGKTWSHSRSLWKERGMMIRHPPISLNNNAIILPAYDEIKKEAVLLTAHPPYQKFEILFEFPKLELLQPVLIKQIFNKNNDEQLTLFFRPWTDPRLIWRSHSNDNGVSWSTPLRTSLPNPLSGISAFTVGPHFAVVYNHTEEHNRYPLSISISRDRGISWDAPIDIDTIKKEVSYPSFINGKNNVVHGVYTYSRKMIRYISLDEMRLLEHN